MRLRRADHEIEAAPVEALAPTPVLNTAARVAPHKGTKRLGDLVTERGLITKEQLGEALELQRVSRKPLGQLLIDLGLLKERTLMALLAEQHGLRIVDLRRDVPEPEATSLISEGVAQGLGVVPLHVREDGVVVVATSEPSTDLLDKAEQVIGRAVQLVLAPPSDIAFTLGNTYRALNDVGRHLNAYEQTAAAAAAAVTVERTNVNALRIEEFDDDAPVVRVVELITTQAVRDRASDIHLEPQGDDVRVRFRVDGTLREVLTVPPGMGPALVSRLKVLAGINIVERRRPQDGQISTEIDGRALDIRMSTVPTVWGEKVVLRLLDKSRPLFKVTDLGMAAETQRRYRMVVHSPFGMVICAGPTGSGKTTTLYATLGEISTPDRNVMTIEDPVEYTFPTINQVQINEAAGVTFASGLRAMMRQDPDIILVGEMRDEDTARTAIKAALTGHLVLSSLHATDAASALHRLLDMGVEPFLITSSVLGIVSQRLLRRTCEACAEVRRPTDDELGFYRAMGGQPLAEFLYGSGCNFCAGSGYLERIGVYELLLVTDEIKELVVSGAPDNALRAQARKQGMRTLREEGLRLVAEGVTTISEVMRCIYSL